MLNRLLNQNHEWSARIRRDEPGYFPRLATRQTPEYFWIGCADSRVPANVLASLDPGEIFVHRNIANIVHSSDMNMLSTLEFAVEVLNIREVIVCGHYGCGGINAACSPMTHGLADHWLEPIRNLARQYGEELNTLTDREARLDRLAELNVLDGVSRVAETPIMRRVWQNGEKVTVHGLIYGMHDGMLRNLNCSIGLGDFDQQQG